MNLKNTLNNDRKFNCNVVSLGEYYNLIKILLARYILLKIVMNLLIRLNKLLKFPQGHHNFSILSPSFFFLFFFFIVFSLDLI